MTDKTLKRPRIGSRHAASASVNGASFLPRLGSTAPSEGQGDSQGRRRGVI
jgi:hypothetical protein